MKRYRILRMDFDSTALALGQEISQDWDPEVRRVNEDSKAAVRAYFLAMFGTEDGDRKISDLLALGPKPFSIVAFHNKFLPQIRSSFVIGSYYPALTAACALGERILNHLIRLLRPDFITTADYKKVAGKDSFDKWPVAIGVLEAWGVLLPDVVSKFNELWDLRWRAIHFDPDTDRDDRSLALKATTLLSEIVQRQFGAWGDQPWMLILPGEPYIAKAAEAQPFIQRVYLPNCKLVGPRHRLDIQDHRISVHDEGPYEEREVTDEEFGRLRAEYISKGRAE